MVHWPSVGLQKSVMHGSASAGQVIGSDPRHAPTRHWPVEKQCGAFWQAVPFGTGVPTQTPLWHVGFVIQGPSGPHAVPSVTGVPVQMPPWHVGFIVHASVSLHGVPSVTGVVPWQMPSLQMALVVHSSKLWHWSSA
jgi:hypothetical protein